MNLLWPKPKDQKGARPAVFEPGKVGRFHDRQVFDDHREKLNLLVKAGRDEYMRRIRQMWERQGRRCCLEGLVKDCPGTLRLIDATFDHDEGRGLGGSRQDDRIEVLDEKTGVMVEQNGAAHAWCNSQKGSVRRSRLLDLWDVP